MNSLSPALRRARRSSAALGEAAAAATAAEGEELLRVSDLTVAFRGRKRVIEIVHGLDLSLHAGRTLVLLGESGSGKSVTARAILRLLGAGAVVEGSVRLGATELTELPESSMGLVRGGAVGMVSQDPSGSLDPLRRAGPQIVEVLLRHEIESDTRRARAHARELLSQVGLRDPDRVLRSYPFELSGGMRQRIAIAIAIGCRPRVLIADEPTTALDVTVQAQVLELFARLQRELNLAILLVTHDVGVARVIGDDVAVMYAGRLVETGPAEVVLTDPRHPYTTALLDALPLPGIARGALRSIPGQPPGPGARPWEGACAFAPRCRSATGACTSHRPPLSALGPGRLTGCDVIADGAPRPGEDRREVSA
ncbi:MAG TPA: ABC transporter ATP-binding protein [Solirubrobacteraceae bacterium]|jgi:oligopeptide/dipeptide ABC transporter ATP-binding protein|nr:ABC transporter ATP-binding protein [Solirubrobacteraceae bacterium]